MNLYEISNELTGILMRLNDFEDGEIPPDLAAALDANDMAFTDKADSVLRARVNYLANSEGLDVEIKRLTALRDEQKKRAEWLKNYVFDAMKHRGLQSLDTKLFKLWIQKNSVASATLDDDTPIPEQFQKVKIEFDGDKARAEWKAGNPLPPGVHVVQGSHLRIK